MSEPVRILVGDVLEGLVTLPDRSVHCAVTSPPYWGLRDYGVDGQIGLEESPDAYVAKMVEVFAGVRRVLRDDGTLWLNLGDSYAGSWGAQSRGPTTPGTLEGHDMLSARQIAAARRDKAGTGSLKRTPGLKQKDLCMVPWRVAMALQADGWYLRSVIVWAKKSPMPESVTDRPTSSWEPIFLLAKSERYFYDAEAVKEAALHPDDNRKARQSVETYKQMMGDSGQVRAVINPANARTYPTRNQRNVWHLGPEPYKEVHFATFPTEIPRRAIKAGTSERGCCPACGAPWVRVVDRKAMVIEPSGRDGRIPGNGQRSTSGVMVERPSSSTLGWLPGCRCAGHEPADTLTNLAAAPDDVPELRRRIDAAAGLERVPCVVLDPFLGSGTTVAVARELGRHGVGCELNPEYAALARRRIGKADKPHTFRDDRGSVEGTLFHALKESE